MNSPSEESPAPSAARARRSAFLLLNERAGSLLHGKDGLTRETLREALGAAGFAVVGEGPADLADDEFSAALARRPDVLLVGGGDGTLSAAAGRLADTGQTLGVLPLGTLNHFSRDLGFPEGWREAVATLQTAMPRDVDLAEVNGRVFINNCSLGAYADAVRRRDALRRERGHGKWPAMFLASLAVFRRLRRMRLRIETPDGTRALRAPFVLIANNRYTGSVLDASLRPRLDEGQLWLYTTRAAAHSALLKLAWQTLVRRIDAADALDVHAFTSGTITNERGPCPVAADGEVLDLKPPFHFRIRPRALRVLTPARSGS